MYKLVLGAGMGFDIPTTEQIKIMHEVGWEGAFTGCSADQAPESAAKALYECGMLYQSTHAPFNKAHTLWEEGEAGEEYADMLVKCAENTAAVGVPLMIVHTIIGMDRHSPSEIGLPRFERIVEAGAKHGVKIAFENTEGEEYLEYLLNHFKDAEYAGFCIDTGHEMCYNGKRDLITKYASKLCCTHLNDNMGQTGDKVSWYDDSHMLPFDGVADWNGIAARLKAADYKGELTFELNVKNKPERNTQDIYKELSFEQYIARALERAKRFKELML